MKAFCSVILSILPLLSILAQSIEDTIKVKEFNAISIIGIQPTKLAGSGEVINSSAVAKMNQPDINKVLRTVPGVNVRDEEGFGLRPNIGLRGTPVNRSAKITLMEDGVLIAPAAYSDPAAYYFPTFARMHSVEVLKGSSQIKYGPYTIGGAINMISTPIPHSFKAFIQANYGSFGTNQQRLWVGDSRKQFDYLFEINRIASNGFKQLDGGGNTGFDRRDVMAKVRWHSKEEAKIQQSLSFKFVRAEEKGNETYLGLTYDDYQNNPLRRYAGTQKDFLDMHHHLLTLNHTISPTANLQINTTAYYAQTFRDWSRANSFGGQSITNILSDPTSNALGYGIMTGKEDGDIVFRSAARTYFSKGIQTTILQHFQTGKVKHKIQLGGRYHEDQADRYGTQSTYSMINGLMVMKTPGIEGNQENQIRNALSASGFINYEMEFKKFRFNPGVRYEYIELEFINYGTSDYARLGTNVQDATNYLSEFLPGATLAYDINAKMNAFAGVHKGFSPPGMPSTSSVNGQAKDEIAMNYELGYRFHSSTINAQIVGFLSDYSNLLGSDNISGGGAGTGDVFNAGHATIQGIEFSLDYAIRPAKQKFPNLTLPIRATYTYTDARFDETFVNGGGDWGSGLITSGDHIPFITPHLAMLSIGLETPTFNVQFSARYVGTTRTLPGQKELILPASNDNFDEVNAIAAYTIIDFSANYNITKIWTVFATVNNLTNNRSIVANLPQGYRPAMPFAANLGLKIRL